MSTIAIQGR